MSPFVRARHRAIERLDSQPGQRLLIVGVGTGADLPLLRSEVDVIGVDLSRAMLRAAARKSAVSPAHTQLFVSDAGRLPFAEEQFDAVLLSLILSVVPDVPSCLGEVARVSRPGSRIVVFDKFLHGLSPSLWRKGANVVTRVFGTDITRCLEELLSGTGLDFVERESAAFGNAYELIGLRHNSC